jgi:hypothetical protein
MTAALDRLREDFGDAERELRQVWSWSDADVAEMVAGIQVAKLSPDSTILECWARWMAMFAEDYRRRAAMTRIAA